MLPLRHSSWGDVIVLPSPPKLLLYSKNQIKEENRHTDGKRLRREEQLPRTVFRGWDGSGCDAYVLMMRLLLCRMSRLRCPRQKTRTMTISCLPCQRDLHRQLRHTMAQLSSKIQLWKWRCRTLALYCTPRRQCLCRAYSCNDRLRPLCEASSEPTPLQFESRHASS